LPLGISLIFPVTFQVKIMVFKENNLVRSKVEIDGSTSEQVKQFNY